MLPQNVFVFSSYFRPNLQLKVQALNTFNSSSKYQSMNIQIDFQFLKFEQKTYVMVLIYLKSVKFRNLFSNSSLEEVSKPKYFFQIKPLIQSLATIQNEAVSSVFKYRMSLRTPSKPKRKPASNSSTCKGRPSKLLNISSIHHNSVSRVLSPRPQRRAGHSSCLASTVKHPNPEISFSRPRKATSKRRQKQMKLFPEPIISPFEISMDFQRQTLLRKCYFTELAAMRNSIFDQVTFDTDKRRLVESLYLNSLDLFRLSEKNLQKRIILLEEFRKKMDDGWNKLTQMLANADNNDRNFVEKAVKSLVGQRVYLRDECERVRNLLEQLRV